MNASDLMTAEPISVTKDTTLHASLRLLWEHDIRHLPVLDESGELVGMVSDRDIQTGMWMFGDEAADKAMAEPIEKIMSNDVFAVDSTASIKKVIAILVGAKIGACPVVEPGTRNLIGIISAIDVLDASADKW